MGKDSNGLGLLARLATYYAVGKASQKVAKEMGIGLKFDANKNVKKVEPCNGRTNFEKKK